MKLVSLNIQGDNHLDRFLPFLEKESPDIICLQEAFAEDLPMIKARLGVKGVHAPMTLRESYQSRGLMTHGVAILSKHPFLESSMFYYQANGLQPGKPVPYTDWDTTVQKVLLSATIKVAGVKYAVANTHFTWTPDGHANDSQRRDLPFLLSAAQSLGDTILCGDFNAPRGGEIFTAIAQIYTDNIPSEIETTLDQNLHNVKGLQYVVDGIFSTKGYIVSNVRVVDGVSDHLALVGTIRAAAVSSSSELLAA